MSSRTVAAVDLGAESGRVTAVSFDGARLDVQVVNRFGHEPGVRDGLLRWDIDGLWACIKAGLGELAAGDEPVSAVGVDTWGVDYGLYDADGALTDGPVSYRDARNASAMRDALGIVGADTLYDRTGVQLIPINTIFSLYADRHGAVDRLAPAVRLLMMPDVFHHLLSGSTVSEYTAVSTTGAYDMAGDRWATDVLDALDIPTDILPEVAQPGTDVGPLTGIPAEGALAGTRVVLPAAHDTASAVVAVPFVDHGGLFISSGTWSLAGIQVDRAVITEASRRANLTNEGGYAGTIRLLRNVMGLWILQQCRRQWAAEGSTLDYQHIAELAAAESGFTSIIDPDASDFLPPGDMPGRIREYCARHGQPVPQTIGAVARCVVDSLALGYRTVVDDIAAVTGSRPPSISIVGGGANHALLSQLTADATGLAVHCGPVEATALGNGAVQLTALGELAGPDQIRDVIAAGYPLTSYQPRTDERWESALARLHGLIAHRRSEVPTGTGS